MIGGYIALYVLFAAGVYWLDRVTHRALFVRTGNHHLPWRLNYSFRSWGLDECLAAVITLCMLMMPPMVMFQLLGSGTDKTLARWLFVLLSLSSIVLAIRLLRLVERYGRHKGWLTVLAALVTVGLGLIAGAEADAFILAQTRVDPAQFPLAQKTLTFIYLVYSWYLSASILLALLMLTGALVYGLTAPGFKQQIRRNRATSICSDRYKPNAEWYQRQWLSVSCVVGAIYTAIILLAFSEVVNARLRIILHESLVYASFHLEPKDCAMTGLPAGTRLALQGAGKVMVARPVEGGYRYGSQPCTLQSSAQIRAAQAQRISQARAQDAYF